MPLSLRHAILLFRALMPRQIRVRCDAAARFFASYAAMRRKRLICQVPPAAAHAMSAAAATCQIF